MAKQDVETTKKVAKKTTKKAAKKTTSRKSSSKAKSAAVTSADGRQLVIVESPTKAKTINKYLGRDFVVMASVGHVRDLPSRAPKGVKQEVPGVDLENDFTPTYEILPQKKKTLTDLKKVAKSASAIWFATDLDREGEAIAWHLAQALGVEPEGAKRVVFNAITKQQIDDAFRQPRPIDVSKVNAQQARRILDRIVGYQVSPLLWKKVAGGLSAGRVQSVAVRLVVEREREIEAFVPDEYWKVSGYFTTDLVERERLMDRWDAFLGTAPDGKPRTIKDRLGWLSEHDSFKAELIEVDGAPADIEDTDHALAVARKVGFKETDVIRTEDPKAKGPAKHRVEVRGRLTGQRLGGDGTGLVYRIDDVQTKRTKTRPSAPFITSTMQQAAANVLGFPLKRAMRVAQSLYEGVDLKGQGQTGLITYMRTDSTFVSPEAIQSARAYVDDVVGDKYIPEKPNFYTTKAKSAQEAHEAIRPTDVRLTPESVRASLTDEQFKLYDLIWKRFVASQMVPAEWDSTSVFVGVYGDSGGAGFSGSDNKGAEAGANGTSGSGGQAGKPGAVFKANGRTLAFDGFYRITGVPKGGDDAILPPLSVSQEVGPLQIEPTQHFTSAPPRYTEASLQKKLEEEGIGRPSTYAAIISTIQDRKYVEPVLPRDRRLRATDLGKVVTDKLVEGFPKIMDVAYTRYMEEELDLIEEERHDWVQMLHDFYGPFRKNLEKAHTEMVHAKAETEPAPHPCPKCGAGTMYRFGRNGRFLSCATYPDCDYAAPIDAEGNPMEPELTNIACPECNSGMTLRSGRFGKFLGCVNYPQCKGILNLDPKKGTIKLPKTPPFLTDLPCPKCDAPLNMRDSKRGFWLSCSKFPKCRGRGTWAPLPDEKKKELEDAWNAHVAANPLPIVKTRDGDVVGEDYVPLMAGQSEDEYAEVS
ncbi:MAG: type I DNA topoisomerase [Candidatus Eisenbacteria bacterium]|uniref:DNA topoisomerase 1 n=1 Tax=Eiseniibacteriota bacterium TaxID=2212470 RepID=A0A956NET2_UNCEI|nr:type I DNA topoisomerase [Candidatus Eisenbacteria bacterium]